MKLNKKLLAIVLTAIPLIFSACSKKEVETKADNTQNQTASQSTSTSDSSNSAPQDNKNSQETSTEGAFSKFTAVDLDKKEYNQDILKDTKLSVINIWGTFCGPCLKEMPDLAELSEEYKDKDVQFIGIVIDTLDQFGEYSNSQIDTAKSIIEKTGVKYLNLLPSSDLINSYLKTVQAIPVTLIVDSDGNILQTFLGAQTKSFFEEAINNELVNLK